MNFRHVIAPLIFGALVFVAIEALVFRGGLYLKVVSPRSYTGEFVYKIFCENMRQKASSPANDILLVGDSRAEYALDQNFGLNLTEGSGYRFINGALAGSSLRTWFYYLRELDPQRNRYKAIVLALPEFDDYTLNDPNNLLDLRFVIPFIRVDDVQKYRNSYQDPEAKSEVTRGLIFKGFIYKQDFQDLALHPRRRLKLISEYKQNWQSACVPEPRKGETLAGLHYDESQKKWTFPRHLSEAQKKEYGDYLSGVDFFTSSQSGIEHREFWLEQIIGLYQSSKTEIFLLRIPRRALVFGSGSKQENSVIRRLAQTGKIRLLPEELFTPLERPELFTDQLHLGASGARLFTATYIKEFAKIYGFTLHEAVHAL